MWILILFFVLIIGYGVYAYNRFIQLDNMAREAWAGVDVQLKRRYDLIPNMVTIVKRYMKHETDTLTTLVQLRGEAMAQMTPTDKQDTENQMIDGLKQIFALAESYPTLMANEQFISLQHNLADIENTLQVSRRYYNATVRDYNVAVRSFPSNILAGLLHLTEKKFFEITELEGKNIQVNFHEK